MNPYTSVNVFLKDDTDLSMSEPLKSDGTVVLHLGNDHRTKVFISTREQAERLFDVVGDIALSFRERFPAVEGSIVVDAVIDDDLELEELPSCPACDGTGPGDCPACFGTGVRLSGVACATEGCERLSIWAHPYCIEHRSS